MKKINSFIVKPAGLGCITKEGWRVEAQKVQVRMRSRRVLQGSSEVDPRSSEISNIVHNLCYYRQMGRIFP